MKEALVQKKLMQLLRETYPTIYVRKIAQGAYSHAGIPDLIGCLNGSFFSIEVKQDNGEVSKLQALEHTAIAKAKGLALVCYGTKDFNYIISRLNEL